MVRFLRVLVVTVAVALHAGTHPAVSGDVEAGRRAFSECEACHQVGVGAEHGIGPHLNGILDRTASSHPDFDYSESFLRLRDGGHVWTAAALDAFLRDPARVAADSRMSIDGIADARVRANLIAFLKSIGDGTSAPLIPGDTDEDVDPAVLAIVGDREYGEWLSGECKACHRADGVDKGIPSILNWPEDRFVIAMHAYRNKSRSHAVMQMIAARLSDEEIAALAAYFANPGK